MPALRPLPKGQSTISTSKHSSAQEQSHPLTRASELSEQSPTSTLDTSRWRWTIHTHGASSAGTGRANSAPSMQRPAPNRVGIAFSFLRHSGQHFQLPATQWTARPASQYPATSRKQNRQLELLSRQRLSSNRPRPASPPSASPPAIPDPSTRPSTQSTLQLASQHWAPSPGPRPAPSYPTARRRQDRRRPPRQ
jgi:hypothetical protein